MFPQDSIHLLHISGSTHGLRTEQILYLGLFLKKHNLTILLDGYQMSPGKTHCIKSIQYWATLFGVKFDYLPIKLLLLLSSLFFSLIFRFLSLSFTKSKILQKLRDLFTYFYLGGVAAIFSGQKEYVLSQQIYLIEANLKVSFVSTAIYCFFGLVGVLFNDT